MTHSPSPRWSAALELSAEREVVAGSTQELAAAIARGADLRIHTRFRHDEHIDLTSSRTAAAQEVSDFPLTYLVDGSWSAGIMTLRQPVDLGTGGFGRPSMSFFLYNQDATQGIARPHLDGDLSSEPLDHAAMAKYHEIESWDPGTNAPSSAFVYEFDFYRFLVRDRWEEVASHDAQGRLRSGSIAELARKAQEGSDVKVGIRGLTAPLGGADDVEVFIDCGPTYYYADEDQLTAQTRPLVRVAAGTPMTYGTGTWDFGWLIVRTDGSCHYRGYDPRTLVPTDTPMNLALRWFAER